MCSFYRLRKSGSAVSLEGWRIATHSTSRREGTLRWNFPNFGSDVTESISVYTMNTGHRVRHYPRTLEYKRLRISHHLELFFPHHQPTSLSHHQSTDLPTTLLVYTFYTTFTMNFSAYFAIAISMALSVQAQCLPNGGKDNPNALP